MNPNQCLACFLTLLACLLTSSLSAQSIEFEDGDRIVILGSEFVEQDIKHNFLEAALTRHWPDRKIEFRNLGWAGDSPNAVARGYFGGQPEGMKRLTDELKRLQPDILILAYTCNHEASEFRRQFEQLWKVVQPIAPRFVVVSSPPAESRPLVAREIDWLNQQRAEAAAFLAEFSQARELEFVDLYQRLAEQVDPGELRWTTDSLRYHSDGYRQAAQALLNGLNIEQQIPAPGADESFDYLRELIRDKNDLYFHRYRPQNETYLRGFRKHEQGQNAPEIEQFDQLIDIAQSRIWAKVRQQPLPEPVPQPQSKQLSFTAATPDEEKAEFTLHKDVEINLFANEPMVANPIHMNFDHHGRLWVATSPIYPHIQPGAKATDQIVILEDVDGDGEADRQTVFADDLLIPTAVLPDGQGGAFVANSTEMLHLSDHDGDGKSDSRRVVLAGFGTEDTHHILHTFRWGPDGAMYFNQSIYIHSHVETPRGVVSLMGSGIWRFEPETGFAEVGMRGLVNPWGLIFDPWGQSFATDGAGGDGINFAFPDLAYPTAVGFRQVLRGMNPGQPKHCGLEIIDGDHFESDWQQVLVTNDFRANRINRFRLSPEGSGYVSSQLPDLLSSRHRAFRPVDVKLGPDGSLFVADWYNPIINHGEVDFRDTRRDDRHGRIWRVTMPDRPLESIPEFESLDIGQLNDLIVSSNRSWIREQARLQLRLRDRPAAIKGTRKWYADQQADQTSERLHLETLWTLDALHADISAVIDRVLGSPDGRIRAAGLRVVSRQPDRLNQEQWRQMVTDDDPQVRLESLHALRMLATPESVRTSLLALGHPMDRYLDFSLKRLLDELQPVWLPRLATGELQFADPASALYALTTARSPQASGILIENLMAEKFSPDQVSVAVEHAAQYGTPEQLGQLLELAAGNESIRDQVLRSVLQFAKQRKLKSVGNVQLLQNFELTPEVVELAGLMQLKSFETKMLELLESTDSSESIRQAAIRGLISFGNIDTIVDVAERTDQFGVRLVAISELAGRAPVRASELAAQSLSVETTSDQQVNQVLDIFLKQKQGPSRLVSALANRELPPRIVRSIIRRSSSAGESGKPLVTALESRAGPNRMSLELSPTELKQLIIDVQAKGRPERGEQIYRRPELNCIKCHAIGGAGGVVGPDLVSLGASSPVDYIIESMLRPDAKIKEGYHTTTIITVDGLQLNGKLMMETDEVVTLRDVDNREIVVPVEDIEGRKINKTSLMPADLMKELRREEFVHLIAFLSSLGKEGPYQVGSERWGRRWIMPDGTELTSRVDGSLPVSEMRGNTATLEVEVTTPGQIGLEVDNPDGLRITRNDMTDNLRARQILVDLDAGIHRFHFRVNKNQRDTLKVKLIDVPGSSGRATIRNQ